ncbi:MAG: ABC transporter permease [Micavibrio sp.]|nr:MAG: ABC transporter permease [Micavibrio sp.]
MISPGFFAGRIFQLGIMLFLVSFLIYMLMGLMPGDPIDMMLAANPEAGPEDAARLRAIYGLDRPLGERYLNWLGAAVQGDFGHSRLFARPVLDLIWPRMGTTFILMSVSLVLTLAIALPVGVYAALKPYGFADRFVNLFCFAGISIPVFWLALILMSVFSVWLGWLPAGGTGGEDAGFLRRLPYYVLPVLTLTIAGIGGYIRYIRSAMIESLSSAHIQTARAKGCSENRVIWVHALRSAMIPVTTIIALDFGTFFSGALITETMFSWPGMGKLIYDSIMGNDFNLALVALLFSTFFVLAANFTADILYMFLDPRVKMEVDKVKKEARI